MEWWQIFLIVIAGILVYWIYSMSMYSHMIHRVVRTYNEKNRHTQVTPY